MANDRSEDWDEMSPRAVAERVRVRVGLPADAKLMVGFEDENGNSVWQSLEKWLSGSPSAGAQNTRLVSMELVN